jgi:hypothetical protein
MLNPKQATADATARITRERISQPLLHYARVSCSGAHLSDTFALVRGGSMAEQLPKNGSDAFLTLRALFSPLRYLAR